MKNLFKRRNALRCQIQEAPANTGAESSQGIVPRNLVAVSRIYPNASTMLQSCYTSIIQLLSTRSGPLSSSEMLGTPVNFQKKRSTIPASTPVELAAFGVDPQQSASLSLSL